MLRRNLFANTPRAAEPEYSCSRYAEDLSRAANYLMIWEWCHKLTKTCGNCPLQFSRAQSDIEHVDERSKLFVSCQELQTKAANRTLKRND